jgi:uncharacterized protein YcbK (DUF882 family)
VQVCAAQKAGPGLGTPYAVRRAGIAAVALVAGSFGFHHAQAEGDTRTISLHHVHTGEDLTITYKRDGRYDEEALKKINWVLRDWRKNEATKMDPEEIDLLWEVYRDTGATSPIYIICGYRSPATNSMLRRRSKGVARFSQHMLGKAIDFYLPGVPLDKLRATAMRLQGGGVGYYPTSGSPFVHVDVGNVRAWPRMTREQLVKLFPNGRTVHLPSDGGPLPGYQLARADFQRGVLHRTAEMPKETKKRSFLAKLFGGAQDAEETDDNASMQQDAAMSPAAAAKPAAPARATVVAAAAPQPQLENVPLPPSRPMYQMASAESRPAPAPIRTAGLLPPPPPDLPPAPTFDPPPGSSAPNSANDVIVSRGFWDSQAAIPRPPAEVPEADLDSARKRLADGLLAAAKGDSTASTGPFARPDRATTDSALGYAVAGLPNAREGKNENRSEPKNALKSEFKSKPAAAHTVAMATPPAEATAPAAAAVSALAMPEPANVTRKGAASVAIMPPNVNRGPRDPLSDPWLRGVTLAASIQDGMTITQFGDPDYARLVDFMQKPRSAVLMSFSQDPHLGMTDKAFTGSAVVFQATVNFEAARTAALK